MINKTMFRILISIFTYFLITIIQGALYANLNVVMNVETNNISESSIKNIPQRKPVIKELNLLIGPDFFATTENDLECIYDFSKRKLYIKNLKTKKYESHSLYIYSGFRYAEFENRLLVYDNFKPGVEVRYFKPVFLEHYYSIKSSRASEGILGENINGKTIYKTENTPLLESSNSGTTITEKESAMFIKFLKYRIGGHPDILKKLSEAKNIPEWLSVYSYDRQVKKSRYKISHVQSGADSSYSLVGFSRGTVEFTGEFIDHVQKAANDAQSMAGKKMADVEIEIQSALEKKKLLPALLGCMEIGLYSSHFESPVCKTNLPLMQTDPDVRTFFANLSATEKKAAKVSFEKLQNLEANAESKKYVLWIFQANLAARMGQSREAFDLYFRSLKENPYITGVYKDVGELFYGNYNMDLAWLCWDAGRVIYPSHSMLKEVDKLEENMLKKFSDFF